MSYPYNQRRMTYREPHPSPRPQPVEPSRREEIAALLEQLATEVRAGRDAAVDVKTMRISLRESVPFVRVSVVAERPAIDQARRIADETQADRRKNSEDQA
jgi:hypothetical protein